jgi:hypothetical protein
VVQGEQKGKFECLQAKPKPKTRRNLLRSVFESKQEKITAGWK